MNTVFIHIPKTGGTSIRKQLPLDVKVVGHNIRSDAFRLYSKKQDDFVFAFFRDPVERFISAFSYLQNGGRNQYDNMDAYVSGAKTLSIEAFAEKLLLPASLWQIHLLPQIFWIQHAQPDFIGRYEQLEEDYKKVCWLKGIEGGRLPQHNASKQSAGIDIDYIRTFVYRAYQKDYEFIEKHLGNAKDKKMVESY